METPTWMEKGNPASADSRFAATSTTACCSSGSGWKPGGGSILLPVDPDWKRLNLEAIQLKSLPLQAVLHGQSVEQI
jgi:hypothetical protein